eukprot:jgi/Bigna1/83698/fgenesh1_pg.113_\
MEGVEPQFSLLGVCKYQSRWRALIFVGGRRENLGCYDSPIEAAVAYDKRAAYLGRKSLNFPERRSLYLELVHSANDKAGTTSKDVGRPKRGIRKQLSCPPSASFRESKRKLLQMRLHRGHKSQLTFTSKSTAYEGTTVPKYSQSGRKAMANTAEQIALEGGFGDHTPPLLRNSAVLATPDECYRWKNSGSCRWGDKCQYLHLGTKRKINQMEDSENLGGSMAVPKNKNRKTMGEAREKRNAENVMRIEKLDKEGEFHAKDGGEDSRKKSAGEVGRNVSRNVAFHNAASGGKDQWSIPTTLSTSVELTSYKNSESLAKTSQISRSDSLEIPGKFVGSMKEIQTCYHVDDTVSSSSILEQKRARRGEKIEERTSTPPISSSTASSQPLLISKNRSLLGDILEQVDGLKGNRSSLEKSETGIRKAEKGVIVLTDGSKNKEIVESGSRICNSASSSEKNSFDSKKTNSELGKPPTDNKGQAIKELRSQLTAKTKSSVEVLKNEVGFTATKACVPNQRPMEQNLLVSGNIPEKSIISRKQDEVKDIQGKQEKEFCYSLMVHGRCTDAACVAFHAKYIQNALFWKHATRKPCKHWIFSNSCGNKVCEFTHDNWILRKMKLLREKRVNQVNLNNESWKNSKVNQSSYGVAGEDAPGEKENDGMAKKRKQFCFSWMLKGNTLAEYQFPKKPCITWAFTGKCFNRKNCTYRHDPKSKIQSNNIEDVSLDIRDIQGDTGPVDIRDIRRGPSGHNGRPARTNTWKSREIHRKSVGIRERVKSNERDRGNGGNRKKDKGTKDYKGRESMRKNEKNERNEVRKNQDCPQQSQDQRKSILGRDKYRSDAVDSKESGGGESSFKGKIKVKCDERVAQGKHSAKSQQLRTNCILLPSKAGGESGPGKTMKGSPQIHSSQTTSSSEPSSSISVLGGERSNASLTTRDTPASTAVTTRTSHFSRVIAIAKGFAANLGAIVSPANVSYSRGTLATQNSPNSVVDVKRTGAGVVLELAKGLAANIGEAAAIASSSLTSPRHISTLVGVTMARSAEPKQNPESRSCTSVNGIPGETAVALKKQLTQKQETKILPIRNKKNATDFTIENRSPQSGKWKCVKLKVLQAAPLHETSQNILPSSKASKETFQRLSKSLSSPPKTGMENITIVKREMINDVGTMGDGDTKAQVGNNEGNLKKVLKTTSLAMPSVIGSEAAGTTKSPAKKNENKTNECKLSCVSERGNNTTGSKLESVEKGITKRPNKQEQGHVMFQTPLQQQSFVGAGGWIMKDIVRKDSAMSRKVGRTAGKRQQQKAAEIAPYPIEKKNMKSRCTGEKELNFTDNITNSSSISSAQPTFTKKETELKKVDVHGEAPFGLHTGTVGNIDEIATTSTFQGVRGATRDTINKSVKTQPRSASFSSFPPPMLLPPRSPKNGPRTVDPLPSKPSNDSVVSCFVEAVTAAAEAAQPLLSQKTSAENGTNLKSSLPHVGAGVVAGKIKEIKSVTKTTLTMQPNVRTNDSCHEATGAATSPRKQKDGIGQMEKKTFTVRSNTIVEKEMLSKPRVSSSTGMLSTMSTTTDINNYMNSGTNKKTAINSGGDIKVRNRPAKCVTGRREDVDENEMKQSKVITFQEPVNVSLPAGNLPPPLNSIEAAPAVFTSTDTPTPPSVSSYSITSAVEKVKTAAITNATTATTSFCFPLSQNEINGKRYCTTLRRRSISKKHYRLQSSSSSSRFGKATTAPSSSSLAVKSVSSRTVHRKMPNLGIYDNETMKKRNKIPASSTHDALFPNFKCPLCKKSFLNPPKKQNIHLHRRHSSDLLIHFVSSCSTIRSAYRELYSFLEKHDHLSYFTNYVAQQLVMLDRHGNGDSNGSGRRRKKRKGLIEWWFRRFAVPAHLNFLLTRYKQLLLTSIISGLGGVRGKGGELTKAKLLQKLLPKTLAEADVALETMIEVNELSTLLSPSIASLAPSPSVGSVLNKEQVNEYRQTKSKCIATALSPIDSGIKKIQKTEKAKELEVRSSSISEGGGDYIPSGKMRKENKQNDDVTNVTNLRRVVDELEVAEERNVARKLSTKILNAKKASSTRPILSSTSSSSLSSSNIASKNLERKKTTVTAESRESEKEKKKISEKRAEVVLATAQGKQRVTTDDSENTENHCNPKLMANESTTNAIALRSSKRKKAHLRSGATTSPLSNATSTSVTVELPQDGDTPTIRTTAAIATKAMLTRRKRRMMSKGCKETATPTADSSSSPTVATTLLDSPSKRPRGRQRRRPLARHDARVSSSSSTTNRSTFSPDEYNTGRRRRSTVRPRKGSFSTKVREGRDDEEKKEEGEKIKKNRNENASGTSANPNVESLPIGRRTRSRMKGGAANIIDERNIDAKLAQSSPDTTTTTSTASSTISSDTSDPTTSTSTSTTAPTYTTTKNCATDALVANSAKDDESNRIDGLLSHTERKIAQNEAGQQGKTKLTWNDFQRVHIGKRPTRKAYMQYVSGGGVEDRFASATRIDYSAFRKRRVSKMKWKRQPEPSHDITRSEYRNQRIETLQLVHAISQKMVVVSGGSSSCFAKAEEIISRDRDSKRTLRAI